jgi:hypothetical protein
LLNIKDYKIDILQIGLIQEPFPHAIIKNFYNEEELKLMAPLTCKMCDYTTTTPSNYDSHLASKEHTNRIKLKSTYCEACQVQCKNNVDYDIHTATQKHKKKIGAIVEPSEYRCDMCDYTTPSKYLFKAHSETKTHQKNKMKAQL